MGGLCVPGRICWASLGVGIQEEGNLVLANRRGGLCRRLGREACLAQGPETAVLMSSFMTPEGLWFAPAPWTGPLAVGTSFHDGPSWPPLVPSWCLAPFFWKPSGASISAAFLSPASNALCPCLLLWKAVSTQGVFSSLLTFLNTVQSYREWFWCG